MPDLPALSVQLDGLEEGTVVSRPNRFVALVELVSRSGQAPVLAHVADSGRLRELIFPGNRVMVKGAPSGAASPPRATAYDLVLAQFGAYGQFDTSGQPRLGPSDAPIWVSVDTRYPNRILGQALRGRTLDEFSQYSRVEAEYWYHRLSPWKEEAEAEAAVVKAVTSETVAKAATYADVARRATRPRSRMDFYLEGETAAPRRVALPPALVEVKSVTLCRDGIGLFPDAPTERGTRHLRELTRGAREGYRSFAVFVAQRDDIEVVRPNRETDPDFAGALKEAQMSGVRLLAYRCSISTQQIHLHPTAIPVVAE